MEVLADLEAGAAEIIIGSLAHALQTEAAAIHPIISDKLPSEDTGLKACCPRSRSAKLHHSPTGFSAYSARGLFALRMMAKADPMMRQVYLRHASYRTSYRPTSSPWRRYRSAMSHFASSATPSRPSPIPSHTRAA
jgi:hypothetical protein